MADVYPSAAPEVKRIAEKAGLHALSLPIWKRYHRRPHGLPDTSLIFVNAILK